MFEYFVGAHEQKKTNKMKSVDIQRPPGNPIFDRNSQSNRSNSIQSSHTQSTPNRSRINSQVSLPSVSNKTIPESKTSVADLSLSDGQGNGNLYKAKEDLTPGDNLLK